MVAAAREVIAIVDHTKWERAAFATFCPTDKISIVLTDAEAPEAMVRDLSGRGVQVRLVGADADAAATPASGRRDEDDGMTAPGLDPGARPAAATARGVASTPPRVELRGISKRFAATQALDDVSLELLPGEVHALVGENGAGKSTLVKILAGVHQPDSGTIRLDGEPTQIPGPAQSRALGIAVVHQEPRLFPDLTVAENVFIGHAPSGRFGIDRLGCHATRGAGPVRRARRPVRRRAPVRGLSMADQQLIEIAKSLSVEARVLILDEPTASLSAHEVERLFTIVRRLRDRGVAILFVSHRLDEVFELCDRATVFRDGRHVITTPTARAHDRRPRPPHGRAERCRSSRRSRRRSARSSSRSRA